MDNIRKITVSDINPQLFAARRFRSTVQTPNSEMYKNQNSYRLMAITDGKATLEISGDTYLIEKNDCLYLVPDERYRILNTHGDFEVINIWFDYLSDPVAAQIFDTVFDDDFNPDVSVDKCEIAEAEVLLKPMVIKDNFRMCSMMEKLYCVFRSVHLCRDIQIKAGLLNLISHLISTVKTDKNDLKAVDEIIGYIHRHITEKITAEELAEKFHYHKNHVGRLIKNATGLTFKQYVMSAKIAYANQLLHETDMSMTEIASALSFYDYSHFRKYFKEYQSK